MSKGPCGHRRSSTRTPRIENAERLRKVLAQISRRNITVAQFGREIGLPVGVAGRWVGGDPMPPKWNEAIDVWVSF